RQVAAIVAKDPNVDMFMSSVAGGGGNSSSNQGRLIMKLKPRNQRALSADEIMKELQPKLSRVPGIRVYLQNPPVINVGGRQSKSQYQFTLMGADIPALYEGSNALLEKLKDLPELADVTTDLQIKNPQVEVDID